ncbi:MAG TPA: OmpA family protein [Candidatus Aquabacterium excrementipullorum]|nr:OmpA family protein [Candidatus Aquabacterium excrementipullorum]
MFRSHAITGLLALACASLASTQVRAQTAPPAAAAASDTAQVSTQPQSNGKVIASGVVPDESTRQAVLAQLRTQYGNDRVVDQLGVGNLVAPPKWSDSLQKILGTPSLKRVSRGALKVRGNVIEVSGEVENEATKQQVLSDISTQLNPTYTVRSSLRVAAAPPAPTLDSTLANRTIEFQPGNALLTPNGQHLLDELVPILAKMPGKRFEVVGHTDSEGARDANIVLSANRANTVRQYLAAKGIPYASLLTSGAGPDHPVADNSTEEGRARNRRIEFKPLP